MLGVMRIGIVSRTGLSGVMSEQLPIFIDLVMRMSIGKHGGKDGIWTPGVGHFKKRKM